MNQQEHDLRSLAWHRYVIARMRSDGVLLEKAKATLEHWISREPGSSLVYLSEWKSAMESGIDAVERLATAEDEHAKALRQCSPISCVLPSRERWRFRRMWSEEHAACGAGASCSCGGCNHQSS